jgi:hypothetical protein
VAHRAANFEEAEAWELDFWQSRSPEQRLSAPAAIRRDVEKVRRSHKSKKQTSKRIPTCLKQAGLPHKECSWERAQPPRD